MQAKSRLEDFSRRPELLSGKRVMHQCKENGKMEWFHATVTVCMKEITSPSIKTSEKS